MNLEMAIIELDQALLIFTEFWFILTQQRLNQTHFHLNNKTIYQQS